MLDSWATKGLDHTNFHFTGDGMDCWSMLTKQILTSSAALNIAKQIQLNPFPCVSKSIVRILTLARLIIFRFGNRQSQNRVAFKKDLDFLFDYSRKARSIECWLVAYSLPKPANIFDLGDSKRPPPHINPIMVTTLERTHQQSS
ncbi:hypothetical protein V2G26_015639 [Clonostachys chloroleuca]